MSEKIFKALERLLDELRPFVRDVVQSSAPNSPWEGELFRVLPPEKQELWNRVQHENGTSGLALIDYVNLDTFAIKFKQELTTMLGARDKANRFISAIQEIKEVRNKCLHYQPIDEDTEERFFSNLKLIAKLLSLNELYDEVKAMSTPPAVTTVPIIAIPSSHQEIKTTETQTAPAAEIRDTGRKIVAWFENSLPHSDIRNGVLDESVFAANLNDVVNAVGPDVYILPGMFFQKTFITAGLQDIAKRVVAALNGEEAENRVISLQTGFGGGKTHTLISLYHIAKAGKNIRNYSQAILPEDEQPNFDKANIAVFTNNTCDVVVGRTVSEGFTIHTLWGEIAYQLGGVEAYNIVKDNDEKRIAPSATIFKTILKNAAPSLILIDELADYCVKAAAHTVGNSDLFSQTNSFMQALTEAVSSVPQTVLIATLPASATEVSNSEIGQKILDALEARIVRIGSSIKPVDDEEIFEVVRRRLFESFFDWEMIDVVAERYRKMYDNRRNDLPANSASSAYANKIRKSYPFHPELIDIFRLRWGNNSKFQRTRGVLRILASIVQSLWKQKATLPSNQALIHISDIQLDKLPILTGQFTNLMGSQWDSVMQADVYSTSSNAYKIDNVNPESELFKFCVTQGLATTILMSSVGDNQHRGLSVKELKFRMLRPSSFQHMTIDDSINKFEQVAHYLYSSTYGEKKYWFQAKPNVNILLNQAKSVVSVDDIHAEILDRLNKSKQFISSVNVLIAPSGDVPEQKHLTMVVLPPNLTVPNINDITPAVKEYVQKIAFTRGNSERIYRNTIFYLCSTERGMSILSSHIRDFLACKKILFDYSNQLDTEQRRDVASRQKTYEDAVKEALIHAYTVMLRCSKKDGIKDVIEVSNFAGDFSSQVTNIINAMKEEDFIVESLGRAILSKNNLLPDVDNPISVFDLYEAFLRFDDKPMITSEQAIIDTVRKHCLNGVFNVAVGEPSNFSNIIVRANIPFLTVEQNGEFWLVHETVVPQPKPTPGTGANTQNGTTPPSTAGAGEEPGHYSTQGSTKYRSVTIEGSVPIENWSQLFTSFIQTLKNNKLSIEVKFTAKSTELSELTSNSQLFKSIKESASQLGLDFRPEE